MHSTPDAVLLLHNVRQRELRDEAAGVRTSRQSNANNALQRGIAAMIRCLRMTSARTGDFLRDSRLWRLGSPLRAEAN